MKFGDEGRWYGGLAPPFQGGVRGGYYKVPLLHSAMHVNVASLRKPLSPADSSPWKKGSGCLSSREGLKWKARNVVRTWNGKPDPEYSGARPSLIHLSNEETLNQVQGDVPLGNKKTALISKSGFLKKEFVNFIPTRPVK